VLTRRAAREGGRQSHLASARSSIGFHWSTQPRHLDTGRGKRNHRFVSPRHRRWLRGRAIPGCRSSTVQSLFGVLADLFSGRQPQKKLHSQFASALDAKVAQEVSYTRMKNSWATQVNIVIGRVAIFFCNIGFCKQNPSLSKSRARHIIGRPARD